MPSRPTLAGLLAAAALGAAAPPARPLGAQAPNASAPGAPRARRGPAAPPDAAFMRGMAAHHAQALAMTALVPARGASRAVRTLAERIDVSQRDEIALMRQWLTDRGEPAPDTAHAAGAHAAGAHDAHGAHGTGGGAPAMPGMLAADELARLAAARGAAFDRLFLTYMVRHHEGALVMVERYLATPGAAQDTEAFRFASDVDADQRAEIARMRALLRAPAAPAARNAAKPPKSRSR